MTWAEPSVTWVGLSDETFNGDMVSYCDLHDFGYLPVALDVFLQKQPGKVRGWEDHIQGVYIRGRVYSPLGCVHGCISDGVEDENGISPQHSLLKLFPVTGLLSFDGPYPCFFGNFR